MFSCTYVWYVIWFTQSSYSDCSGSSPLRRSQATSRKLALSASGSIG